MNMKGSGASAINSFSGGMVSDVDVLSTKNNTYKYAENARISQEGSIGSLSNIEDFEHVISLPSDAGEFMAYYKANEYTILISKDTDRLHVYKYMIVDGDESLVKVATLIDSVDDNRIANIKHLSITASIESEKIERLYIADGIHALYSINMYNSQSSSDNVELEIYRDSVLIGRYFSSYDSSVQYSIGDVVPYNGYFWKAQINNPSTTPATGPSWLSLGLTDAKLRVITSTSTTSNVDHINFYMNTYIDTYEYNGDYIQGVAHKWQDVVKHDNKFWMCSNSRGTVDIPGETANWSLIDENLYFKYRPITDLPLSHRYIYIDDNYTSQYKQYWFLEGEYYQSDIVQYDGSFYAAAITYPTGVPGVSSDWIYTNTVAGMLYVILDVESSGSIYSYITGVEHTYMGAAASDGKYFIGDVILHNGIYWKVKNLITGYLDLASINDSNFDNVGNTTDLGYYFSVESETTTTQSIYKYTTLLGVYRGIAFDIIGYNIGDVVIKDGIYYRALIFNPAENVNNTSSWEELIKESDLLFTIQQIITTPGVIDNNTPVYDIAKIQIGSSLYSKPDVEVSIENGGSLSVGKYYYVIKYTNNSGAESSEMYVSNGINANKSNSFGGIIDAETSIADISNIGINLLIKGVDCDAYGINVYRIYYNGSGIGYKASLIYSDKISRVNGIAYPINVFDSSDIDILNDVTDSILFNKNITTASVIENKDGLLFAGNINIEKDSNIDYDTRAFAFDHTGSFKYRNSTDQSGTIPYEIKVEYLNDENSTFGLKGKDSHDFINDDIYTKDRYRDVKYRYKFSDSLLNGKVYGGFGKNVSYEFVHTYLIAAKESSVFTNIEDNDWFKIGDFKNEAEGDGNLNIDSTDADYKDLSCKSLIDVNIHRDDLVIKVGDKDREISKMTIRNQMQTAFDSPLDIIDISSFGIKNHTGKLDYSNALIANTFSGFKRNEIFRFAVRFKLTDGTYTEPMWISDIRFPANYMTGRVAHNGPNSTAPDIFSFSSFVAPEDTEEGIDLINTTIENAVDIVDNGFASIEYEDKLGSNELSRAELLVKPLGIKFEFDNVPENVESAKILYQELSPIERTILGQFIVSRIGMFSNSGVDTTETGNMYYESQSNGFGYPHPTPSMKYTYGIMPPREFAMTANNAEFLINPLGLSIDTKRAGSFDAYSSVASPIRSSDNSGSEYWGQVDKMICRTSAISTSPYFSDISNYMLISPEVSYMGDVYSEFISNIGKSIVFENMIYSKNTKPFSSTATSISSSVGYIYISGKNDQPLKFRTNSDLMDSAPFNYTSGDQNDVTDYFTYANSYMFSWIPTAMHTGSFFNESDRIESILETTPYSITMAMCGPTLFSILEAVLSYRKTSNGSDRLGDSAFKIDGNRWLRLSSTKYTEGTSTVNNIDINIQSNVKLPDISYVVGAGYVPGSALTITNSKKGLEKVWDDDDSSKTNLPISIKTFMSGHGYIIDYGEIGNAQNSGNSISHVKYYTEAGPTDLISPLIGNSVYRLDANSSIFGRIGSANSATIKYFKSIIPSRNYYNRNTVDFGIDEYTDSYASFFKQNGKAFDDYEFYLSDRDGVKLRDYNPIDDADVSSGYDSLWNFPSINIKSSIHASTPGAITGTFDMSPSINLSGYSGYINYSKSLSADMFGIKDYIGTANSEQSNFSLLSSLVRSTGENIDGSSEFQSMINTRRGRISGKHGAGVIVTLDDSIPMVGHIMSNDYKLDAFNNVQLSRYIDQMNIYKNTSDPLFTGYSDALKRTRLYWNVLDGSCSSHTSTYIVDVRSKTNKLFKSSSLADKRNAKYIESAQSINLGSNSSHKYYVFGGGTYVTMFDYTNTYGNRPEPHSSYDNDPENVLNWNSVANACHTGRLNMLVPIESSINTHVDSGETFHKHNDPWMLETTTPGVNSPNSGYSTSVITTPGGDDEFMYDDAFSSKKDFNAIENNFSKDDVFNSFSYKSRVIASEKKILGEQNDSWSIFKLNSYIDLNPSNGSVNGIESIGNRLYAFQDKAIAALSVNERSLITDSSGDNSQLLLGTGGVLPYYSYLSESYGLSPDTMSAINKSSNGIYFYDKINESICRISNTLGDLSRSTNTKSISKTITASNSSIILPWFKNGEILFKFDDISYLNEDNKSILFSELGSTFESFVTDDFDYAFGFGSDIRVMRVVDDEAGIYKPTENTISKMLVSFITNDSMMNTKIFDSIDINLSWTHNNTINNILVENNELNIEAKYSNSISNTGGFKPLTSSSLSRQNKNADIHCAIPRVDNTISKMRDKYINSTYSFNGGFNISLPYIKTNYKYSAV